MSRSGIHLHTVKSSHVPKTRHCLVLERDATNFVCPNKTQSEREDTLPDDAGGVQQGSPHLL